MWDFNHAPLASALADRYQLHSTQPSLCADDLLANRADLGLIPIASLTPELAIVSDCAIASLDRVRSIQLIIKLRRPQELGAPHLEEMWEKRASDLAFEDEALAAVRTVAADTASRSSLAYSQILFRKFIATDPAFSPRPPIPSPCCSRPTPLCSSAIPHSSPRSLAPTSKPPSAPASGSTSPINGRHTHLPWVAAVWAVRPESLTHITAAQLTADLQLSRDHGLAHIDSLIEEWTPRIAIPPDTIRRYLTQNIHYSLSPACIDAIALFRRYAAETAILPPLPTLRFL